MSDIQTEVASKRRLDVKYSKTHSIKKIKKIQCETFDLQTSINNTWRVFTYQVWAKCACIELNNWLIF